MTINYKNHFLSGAIALSLMLTGCGGDSSTSSSPTLSGTAATGAAISGATVTAKCKDGATYTATTNTAGKYTISGLPSSAFGCALEITQGATVLHSYATGNGTVNITPLTDMALTLAIGADPSAWFATFSTTTPTPNLAASKTALLSELANKGFTIPSGDPFSTSFNADHTGWDSLLDNFQQALNSASQTYSTLLSSLQSGGTSGLNTSLPTAPPPASTYAISGMVSGADTALTWRLYVDGSAVTESQSISGSVLFTESVASGKTFGIQVITPPTGKTCTVTPPQGVVGNAHIDNIAIVCTSNSTPPDTSTYSISGTVSGIESPAPWKLYLDDVLAGQSQIPTSGTIVFGNEIASGKNFRIEFTPPSGKSCTVTPDHGVVSNANITNIAVVCTNTGVTGNTGVTLTYGSNVYNYPLAPIEKQSDTRYDVDLMTPPIALQFNNISVGSYSCSDGSLGQISIDATQAPAGAPSLLITDIPTTNATSCTVNITKNDSTTFMATITVQGSTIIVTPPGGTASSTSGDYTIDVNITKPADFEDL